MTRPPGRGPQPDPGRRPQPGVTDLRQRLRSGYGSPEGVVYAAIGTHYQDIDPAGAGANYKKTTASGNTGWVELGAGGGGGAWCMIDHNAGWADGAAGFSALIGDVTIDDQSGAFTQVDASTLSLPAGLYIVEWSFDFWFPFVNPYAGTFFGDGWALWRGGPAGITGSVRNFTSYNETMLIPVTINNDGGGDASVQSLASTTVAWRGIVKAGGGFGSLLALGIADFFDFYPSALDWTLDFTEVGQAGSNGSGHHNVWIASIG